MKSVTLYCQNAETNTDKVYKIDIEKKGNGYMVTGWNGRKGNTLVQQPKTLTPVSLSEAEEIFLALLKSKVMKGYHEGEGAVSYASAPTQKVKTGYMPQLLNQVSEDDAQALILNDNWMEQEKENGKRIGLTRTKLGSMLASNRKGESVGCPQNVLDAAYGMGESFELDGEMVGETYKVFDLLSMDGQDLRDMTYIERFNLLVYIWQLKKPKNIVLTKTAVTTAEKQALHQWLKDNNREGAVFKRKDAKYSPGRPNKGGNHLKCKFWVMCTAIVSQVNEKRSVALKMFDGTTLVDVGNCTISPDKDVPPVGTLCEIRYLYIVAKGGFLYQPQFLFPRDDVDYPDDISTLKINSNGEEES